MPSPLPVPSPTSSRPAADEAERLRRLPQSTVDALVAAGLMRLYVPAVYGGPEVDPPTALEAMAEVARADAAAGWCTMIGGTTSSLASFLPPATAGAIYGDPTVVTGGVFAPNGRGHVDGDTVTVTGRWQWGSGTQHCRWIVGGVLCDDDQFRVCYLDAADVTFHDTWYTSGLRGSGSLDFSVDGAVVPLERSFLAFGARVESGVAARALPELHAARRGGCRHRARHRAAGARRAHRAGDGEAAAVLEADAGPEPVHPDRAGPRRGRAAIGAGVPARRGGRGVGDVRRR